MNKIIMAYFYIIWSSRKSATSASSDIFSQIQDRFRIAIIDIVWFIEAPVFIIIKRTSPLITFPFVVSMLLLGIVFSIVVNVLRGPYQDVYFDQFDQFEEADHRMFRLYSLTLEIVTYLFNIVLIFVLL